MFNKVIIDPEQLPISYKQRRSTDVFCTIFSSIFAIIMLIIALLYFDKDSTKDIYFANFTMQNNNNITQADLNGFTSTIFYATIITFSLGLIWMTIVHLIPSYAPLIAYSLAIISLVAIGVLFLLVQSTLFGQHNWVGVILAIIAIILAIILLVSCLYCNELNLQGTILKYSVRFLLENPCNFWYVLLFLIFYAGLIVLFLFQHIAFSNANHSNNNFFNFLNPGFLGVLNMIQFVWGLQFLRDAFIFIVSGNSVDWYWGADSYTEQPSSFDRLLSKNWGTVVSGSFMNLFLRLPLNIAQKLSCYHTNCGICSRFCNNNCDCCTSFIGLVRTDSYAYTNIFGTPYCNSSRQCEKLCSHSQHFIGFQSPMRNFRMVAGILLVAISMIMGFLILDFRVKNINLWFLIDLLAVVVGTMSFFVSIHPSAGEGIQTSFIVEEYLSSGIDYMQRCIPSFRRELQAMSKQKDGHS